MVPLRLQIDDSFFLPEERNGYLVSSEMKKVWAVELDLLNEFSKVCSEHNLNWFAHAGTMLGAARHHGFIPWDDDIDVVMPRDDYERLCDIGKEAFASPYFFQNEETDRYHARNFSRLRNSETTAIFEYEFQFCYPYNQGIFIDIFPMDNVPADIEERNRHYSSLYYLNNCCWQLRDLTYFYHPKKGKGFIKKLNYFVKHLYYRYLSKEGYLSFMERHKEIITKYNSQETGWVGESVIPPLGRQLWRKDWVTDSILLPFEMLTVPVPINYEACLKATFGDWHTPKKAPTLHGKVFFNTDYSYHKFLNH